MEVQLGHGHGAYDAGSAVGKWVCGCCDTKRLCGSASLCVLLLLLLLLLLCRSLLVNVRGCACAASCSAPRTLVRLSSKTVFFFFFFFFLRQATGRTIVHNDAAYPLLHHPFARLDPDDTTTRTISGISRSAFVLSKPLMFCLYIYLHCLYASFVSRSHPVSPIVVVVIIIMISSLPRSLCSRLPR